MRVLIRLITAETKVINRTTGSASINAVIVPEVRVTKVDRRTIIETPDARIAIAFWSLGFTRVATKEIKPNAVLHRRYKISILRGIVPLAFP